MPKISLYSAVSVLGPTFHGHQKQNWKKQLAYRLFPSTVFDGLQYASVEKKAWEIWSCAVMSGRQANYLEALSCNVHPRDGSQSICKAATISFVVHNAKD